MYAEYIIPPSTLWLSYTCYDTSCSSALCKYWFYVSVNIPIPFSFFCYSDMYGYCMPSSAPDHFLLDPLHPSTYWVESIEQHHDLVVQICAAYHTLCLWKFACFSLSICVRHKLQLHVLPRQISSYYRQIFFIRNLISSSSVPLCWFNPNFNLHLVHM